MKYMVQIWCMSLFLYSGDAPHILNHCSKIIVQNTPVGCFQKHKKNVILFKSIVSKLNYKVDTTLMIRFID